MSRYNFDAPFDRSGTNSLKFDCAEAFGRSANLLALWVADMDFRAPDEVLDALDTRVRHATFGYTDAGPAFFGSVVNWMREHHGWEPDPASIVLTPGIVCALAMAVRAYTQPGEGVLVQPPVYHPFSHAVINNGRELVEAPLSFDGDSYSIDFAEFERIVAQRRPRLFLLCNPHNPVGRVWSAEELQRMWQVCAHYGVEVLSDEIHMDFARPGYAHVALPTLGSEAASQAIVCTSASKTFSLAGLQTASIIIADEDKRDAFKQQLAAAGIGHGNIFGLVATQAAYEFGGPWLSELKTYLEGNWALLAQRLEEAMPELKLIPAQSTYLAWVDCRRLGMAAPELERFIEDEAGLWLNNGEMFGEGGAGFVRINLATQRANLARALDQLAAALASRR